MLNYKLQPHIQEFQIGKLHIITLSMELPDICKSVNSFRKKFLKTTKIPVSFNDVNYLITREG